MSKAYSFKQQCEKSDAALRVKYSFKLEDITTKEPTEPITLDKEDSSKIKAELIETTPDIQSDVNYDHPQSVSSSDSEWDNDAESKIKLSKLKVKQSKESVEKNPFACDLCNKNFIRKSHLVRHLKSKAHLIKNNPINSKKSEEKLDLETENIEKEGKNVEVKFNCLYCERRFNNKKSLASHMNRKHNHRSLKKNKKPKIQKDPSLKSYKCTICEQVFNQRQLLRQHFKIHIVEGDKPYLCPTCNKTFHLLTTLKVHLIRHRAIRPYLCFTCGKSYATNKDLERHLRWHTGEKPFKCNECSANFTRLSSLTKHKLNIHDGVRHHECDVCQKKFTSIHHVKRHKLTHTGEKPHACSHCPKAFSQRVELVIHTRMHTGEKPFTCDVCDHTFRQKSSLNTHRKSHHKSETPTVPVPYQPIYHFLKSFS